MLNTQKKSSPPWGLLLFVAFCGIGFAYQLVGNQFQQKTNLVLKRHTKIAEAMTRKYCTKLNYPSYYNWDSPDSPQGEFPEGFQESPRHTQAQEEIIHHLYLNEPGGTGSKHWMWYFFTSIAIMQWGSGAMIYYVFRNPIITVRLFSANFTVLFLAFILIVNTGEDTSIGTYISWFIYWVTPYPIMIAWLVYGGIYLSNILDESEGMTSNTLYALWHYFGIFPLTSFMYNVAPWLPLRIAERNAVILPLTSIGIFVVTFAICAVVWVIVEDTNSKSQDQLARSFLNWIIVCMIIVFMFQTYYGITTWDTKTKWNSNGLSLHEMKRICKNYNEELVQWKKNHKEGWLKWYKKPEQEFEKIYENVK